MSLQEEQQALKEIADLLPTGYVKFVPFSTTTGVAFQFNGVLISMSALYLCEELNCYMFDLAWGSTDKIYGIPMRCGIDILKQYSTPLPNMYATNHVSPGQELSSWRDAYLFVIDASVLENG